MSNLIYGKNTPFHYTYQITELHSNKKYIGVRSSFILPKHDLGVKYFSSSKNKEFIKNQKLNPSNYKYEIIKVFNSRKDANEHEMKLHEKYNVAHSDDFYNLVNSRGFCAVGKVATKNKDGEILFVDVDDPRYLSGELVHVASGNVVVKDKNDNHFYVSVDDPRYLSGELVSVSKGKIVVRGNSGNNIQISVDEYHSSDKYLHVNAGFAIVLDCDGNILRVPVDDPRYLSGEYKSLASTKFRGKLASTGENITVDLDDPRIKSGEVVGITKGLITVKDKSGNYTMCTKDDPRYLSGELVGVTTGQFPGKDRYGNKYSKISKDDPRVLSGDIIHHSGYWYKVNNEIYSMKQLKIMYPGINIKARILSDDYPGWICIGKKGIT